LSTSKISDTIEVFRLNITFHPKFVASLWQFRRRTGNSGK